MKIRKKWKEFLIKVWVRYKGEPFWYRDMGDWYQAYRLWKWGYLAKEGRGMFRLSKMGIRKALRLLELQKEELKEQLKKEEKWGKS